ncbi:MAG: exodeoxyribonuclease VII small subunit [Dysgonamonadaceae bacterium]|jgi:exodeoxyribonuclease VII small subunit|nr:exodeoxyribonuclease VII small subunit [Dysgonamonadaceae bacterium]
MEKDKKLTYREALERLERIQSLIEGNEIDVDDLSEKLKEASELLEICRAKLFSANEETQKIMKKIKR